MKKTTFLKKLTMVAAAAVMSCAMAVGACAAGNDYSLSSATIKVGDTWSMSVAASSYFDWDLSSEYIANGPGMQDKPGVLKQVSYKTSKGVSTITYEAMQAGTCTVTLTDRSKAKVAEATITVTDSGTKGTQEGGTQTQENTQAPAVSDAAPAADTRTEQQKEIDEAKANGTWEQGYTTCQKCGYHNWTRKGSAYVCDTCGNEVATVAGPQCVKGYVAPDCTTASAAAPETRYATAKQAQAAADKREAAYADAVAAYQKQLAAKEAAYLAALKG